MSRVGKKPIPIPDGVVVEVSDGRVTVEGPKGKLNYISPKGISVSIKDKKIIVSRHSNNKLHKSLHGLVRSLINNMVKGVCSEFQKTLVITGVGYKAQMKGRHLLMQLGFSHPVEFSPPPGIVLEVEGQDKVKISGIDKQLVGEVASKIRNIRPPDPYKGKGIRYIEERIRKKAGKAGV